MKNKNNDFSAFVGLDWADQKHDVSVISATGDKPEHHVIKHSPESLSQWLESLRQKYPAGQIAICLEQSKGALIYHLMMYDFITLFPINPKSLARFREALTTSGAKSDISDADYLREFLTTHRDRLTPWQPDDEQTRTITMLAENRRKAVCDRAKLMTRLRATLKLYYPQALHFTGDSLKNDMALAFLRKWPQFTDVKRAQQKTIIKFYTNNNCRSERLIKERLDIVKNSVPHTNDQAAIKSCLILVKMFVAQITQLNDSIAEFDRELKIAYEIHPDKIIFDSFPGAGEILKPRLLSAWGSDRSRHPSAESMQQHSGIAPVTIASGNSKAIVRRLACPKFLLQTFHEYATHSRQYSIWAQAYYEMLRERGKKHHTAIRSLAFKWIRIMFRCWQNREAYDEVKYLQALKKSNSPLRSYL